MIWRIAKKLLRVTVGPIRCIERAKKQQNEAMQKKSSFFEIDAFFWVVVTLAYLASIYYITFRAMDSLLFLFAHRCLNGEFCFGSWYTDACEWQNACSNTLALPFETVPYTYSHMLRAVCTPSRLCVSIEQSQSRVAYPTYAYNELHTEQTIQSYDYLCCAASFLPYIFQPM